MVSLGHHALKLADHGVLSRRVDVLRVIEPIIEKLPTHLRHLEVNLRHVEI